MVKAKKGRAQARKRIAPKSTFSGEQPTVEQLRQRGFAIEPIVDDGQVTARAYRRQPLYMTLSKTSDRLTPEEIAALDIYRETHDRADMSFTKSCLDLDGSGRMRKPDAIMHVNNAVRDARDTIRRLESALGPLAGTLRAVALDDRTFSDVAMERYGSRVREWIKADEPVMLNGRPVIIDGKIQRQAVFVEQLVPKSGRHREIIRAEYLQAVKMLTAAIRDRRALREAEEVWVAPLASGGARIFRGAMGPKGAYRLRGHHSAIGATFAELARELNGELEFPDFDAAKVALAAAAFGRLIDVDMPSIAA